MSFVYDNSTLPTNKIDAAPLNRPANQGITAAEWNTAMQASLDLRAALLNSDPVNVKSHGAVGDGITDDTDAFIAALEEANGVTTGTWETGGDNYVTYPTRNHRVVAVPPGTYKLTRSIPIRFRGIGIACTEDVGPTEPSEGKHAILYGDHNNPIFTVNATYNVNGFFLKGLDLRKRNAYVGQGHGVSVSGPNYVFGVHFYNVRMNWCADGFHMVCQDLGDGTGSTADLVFDHCQLANNAGYGISLRGHAAIGKIDSCSIVANAVGGIKMGCKGYSISHTDLEGQENPLAITNGSSSEAVVVGPGNYFEGNPVTATPALISIGLCDTFKVFGNQFSGDSLCPQVLAATCANGEADVPIHQIGCSNVHGRGGSTLPTAGTGTNELSYTFNPNRIGAPRGGAMTLPALNERGGGNHYFKYNGRVLAGSRIQTGDSDTYRQLINGFTSVGAGDYVFFAFSFKYMVDLPHGNPLVQLLGNVGAGVTILKSWGFYVPADSLKVGDNVCFVVGMKNDYGATMSTLSAYFYPYGSDTTPGLGARMSQVLQWQQTSPLVADINPLDVVSGKGTAAPISGDWGVGDRVGVIAAAGEFAAYECTVGGAPGTWEGYGVVGAKGVIHKNVTPTGTGADTTEDDLMTYALPGASLDVTGRGVRVTAWGDGANTADVTTLRAYFGATAVVTKVLEASQANTWRVVFEVMRTGAATQTADGAIMNGGTLNSVAQANAAPTETLSGNVTIKLTGQRATSSVANSVRQLGMIIELIN